MVQRAARSEASSLNSLGPKGDWLEVRGEALRPRTALSWPLARWVAGESEEATRRTLSARGPENPKEKEIALSLKMWVPLALGPTAEQKQKETQDSPPGPPPGEGAALSSPSPEKEQTPTSPGCPRQSRFVNFLDNLGPGWDAGGAALLREARRAGPGVDSARGGAALEDAGGRPRRRADRGLVPGAAADGASRCKALDSVAEQSSHGMQGRGCLARSTIRFGRESSCQLTGFGRETRTIPPSGGVSLAQVHHDRSLTRPPGSPAIEGSEDGGGRRAASGRERGHPRLRQLFMHLREKRHRSRTRL